MQKFGVAEESTQKVGGSSSHVDDEAELAERKRASSEDVYRDHLEEILNHVGPFGTYQKLLFLAMMPFGVCYAFVYFVQMFIAATPHNHWCKVPQLQHLDLLLRRNLTAPRSPEGGVEKCLMFVTNWDQVAQTLTPPPHGTPTVPCQHGWEFELKDIPYPTVVSEREWVCEYSSYAPTAQSLFFLGSTIGGLLFGWLADSYGRVPALLGSNMIGFIGGVATIYTKDAWDFSFCRLLVGMANDNCFVMMYILVLEYVGLEYRTYVANFSIALYFGVATVMLPWIALWIANWRHLVLWTSLPMLFALLTPCTVPESTRWLETQGYGDRAALMLKRFEWINRKKIPEDVFNSFINSANDMNQPQNTLMDMYHSKMLRIMMGLLIGIYMCCAVVYDGIVRLSDNLGLDFFLTFSVSSTSEIFAVILMVVFLDRWGRRYLTCFLLVLVAGLLFLCLFVPKGVPQVTLAFIARLFSTSTGNILFQWATELLPTSVRGSGSAIVHVSGYMSAMLSPFIVYSGRLWDSLPVVILGLIAILGLAIASLLPETMGRSMPQTFADGEGLVHDYSLVGKFFKK